MGDSYGRLKERIGTPVNSFGAPSSYRLCREILDLPNVSKNKMYHTNKQLLQTNLKANSKFTPISKILFNYFCRFTSKLS